MNWKSNQGICANHIRASVPIPIPRHTFQSTYSILFQSTLYLKHRRWSILPYVHVLPGPRSKLRPCVQFVCFLVSITTNVILGPSKVGSYRAVHMPHSREKEREVLSPHIQFIAYIKGNPMPWTAETIVKSLREVCVAHVHVLWSIQPNRLSTQSASTILLQSETMCRLASEKT